MKSTTPYFFFLLLTAGITQENVSGIRSLTLGQCIRQAMITSPRAEIYRHENEQAYWDHKLEQLNYLPQLYISGQAPQWSESLNSIPQDDNSLKYFYQTQTSSNVGVTLSQPVPLTGGRLFASSSLSYSEIDTSVYWSAQPFSVGFTQPVFKTNTYKWDINAEAMQFEQSRRQHQEAMAGLAIDVVQSFFDFYIAGLQLENARFNRAVNDTIFNISNGRYTVGKIAENDLLRSELAVMNSRNRLDQAKLDYTQAYRNLVTLLGLAHGDSIRLETPGEIPVSEISRETALSSARQFRSEYIGWKIQLQDAERNTREVQTAHRLQLDLTASIGFNQTADTFNEVYDSPLDSRTVSLSFELPLGWGKRHADLLSAAISEERSRKSTEWTRLNFEQNLEQSVDEFNLLYRQLQVSARSDTIATLQFDVAKNRYLIGKIDITNLFNAQNEKDNARQAYYQYLKKTWVSYYQLRQQTMYDFHLSRPVVTD